MEPVVNGLEETYESQVVFLRLNANQAGKDAFAAGGFRGHPAFVLMQPDGDEVWRGLGMISYAQIDDALQQALADDS